MRMVHHVERGDHRACGNTCRLTALGHDEPTLGDGPLPDQSIEFGHIGPTVLKGREPRICPEFRSTEEIGQRAPFSIGTTCECDPLFSTGAAGRIGRASIVRPGSAALGMQPHRGDRAGLDRLSGEEIGDRADDGFALGDLEETALDVAEFATDQRGQCSAGRESTDEMIREDRRRARWVGAALVAPQVRQAARGLGARPVAAPMGPHAAGSHELAGHHGDARVGCRQILVAEAKRSHRSGCGVLDDHIGMLGQVEQHLSTFSELGVHTHGLLRAAGGRERGSHLGARDHADEVVMRATLDLDDLGAIFGKQLAGLDTDSSLTEVHDAQTDQRKGRLRSGDTAAGFTQRGEHRFGVCTEYRGRSHRPDTLTIEFVEARWHLRFDPVSDLHGLEGSARVEVLVAQGARCVIDRRADDAAILGVGRDLLDGEFREQFLIQRVENGLGNAEPTGERVVLLVLQVLGLAQPCPHLSPLCRTEHDESHVAVSALEDRIHRSRTHPQLGEVRSGDHAGRVVRQ